MAIRAELKKRHVLPWVGAYVAGGFVVVEAVDQFIGRGLLPDAIYSPVLIFYLFGIPATLVLAWFHGERGAQRPPAMELWLHASLLVAAFGVSLFVVRRQEASATTGIDAAAEVGLDPRGVAVLYFEDLSGDGELGYLADGLTEALIDQLDQVRALDVVSRNGVAGFREADLSRDSIARSLNVGTLVEGSVEPLGEQLRVTARLVDGVSGVDLERTSFELPADDPFAVQDSVIQQVSRILRQRIGEEVTVRERRTGTASPDAWVLVQRGEKIRKDAEDLLFQDEVEGAFAAFARADSSLGLAAAADTAWVEPLVLRAEIDYRRARLSAGDPTEAEAWLDTGMGQAQQALRIEPGNARALAARGKLEYLRWLLGVVPDPQEAERLFERARQDLELAVETDPTLADAHNVLSHLYYQTDEPTSVVIAARRAYEEDAYLSAAPQILWRLFLASYDLEQTTQAVRWCDEGSKRFPENHRFVECQLFLMTMPASEADPDYAWELAARLAELAPAPDREFQGRSGRMLVGGILARAGLVDSARSVIERSSADRELDPAGTLAQQEAFMWVLAGDHDRALDQLRAFVAVNPELDHATGTGTSDVYWWWRDLQTDPRFQRVMGSTR